MKALLFGSIGTIIETSEIQRQSFNKAFKDAGLNWYWNIATYCDLLKEPGGKKRIKKFSNNSLDEATIDIIHSKKRRIL
jgi:beta-phosphoglucomutase-like phosphatase (HAD superfamily)